MGSAMTVGPSDGTQWVELSFASGYPPGWSLSSLRVCLAATHPEAVRAQMTFRLNRPWMKLLWTSGGATATIQGRRRLGLTATLVREDGREGDVFALVGPKRYDLPWQLLQQQGFIADTSCHEVRVRFTSRMAERYERANANEKFRIASSNPRKMEVIAALFDKHREDNILVIGTYLDQLKQVARKFRAPLITGKTPHREREVLFDKFRRGRIKQLVVSKVANFSIDLPDANIAIQISGTFGSRQEEAQRLGRILRPKKKAAIFYTVVTGDSKEQEFALKRQLFLTEQGYRYHIVDHDRR